MLCEGFKDRDQRAWDRAAWQTAYSLQPWGFTGTPADLLGHVADREAENAAMDAALGVPQTYEQVMAAQAAKGLSQS